MIVFLSGVLGGIRTPDLLVRSQVLYPAELQAQIFTTIVFYHTNYKKSSEFLILL